MLVYATLFKVVIHHYFIQSQNFRYTTDILSKTVAIYFLSRETKNKDEFHPFLQLQNES